MRCIKYALVALGFALGASSGPVLAIDYSDGMLAYSSGDYNAAFKIWNELASTGHMRAQFNVAYMYEFGIVSKPDYQEAIKWYKKAAVQGYARAQNFLGWMYEMGKGVDRNRTEAMKWLELAANQGNEDAVADYKLVLKRYLRDMDQQYQEKLFDTLVDELQGAHERYNTKPFPTNVLQEASNYTG